MKEICLQTGLPYETLKFYCNEGLVPNVKRDRRNYRVFDERDLAWIRSLLCLKKCGMGIADMKEYVKLCKEGQSSIPRRKEILRQKREELQERMAELLECLDYIDRKQAFYDGVLEGRIPYTSNLIRLREEPEQDGGEPARRRADAPGEVLPEAERQRLQRV